MRQLIMALIVMTCSFNIQALFWHALSEEDQTIVVQLGKDIQSWESQESEEEEFAYLQAHRVFMLSIISRINYLIPKYPHKTLIEAFIPARDYLQETMTRYGLN